MKFFQTGLPILLLAVSSFGLGSLSVLEKKTPNAPLCLENQYQEIAIVEMKEIAGDSLKTSLSGAVRLVWNEAFVEGDGEHLVALGQLPSDEDKNFRDFAYTGNAGTLKFYPSNTYAARGTAPAKRRFFADKAAALKAGFVASKLVK
jgi:hypothetical protein